MEKALPSLKDVVILALISSYQILCTEGRQIKSEGKQEVASNKKDSLNEIPKKRSLSMNHNSGEEAASSPPSNHNNVSVQQPKYTEKEEMPMFKPKATTSSIGFNDSAMAVNKDDFRPLQSGSSPGIGHSDQEVDPKSLGATSGLEHSVTAYTDDFLSTARGHSPRIGH